MKIYSKSRGMWIKFPTKNMDPMIEPHKHNLTLKAETPDDELLIDSIIKLLEGCTSDQILDIIFERWHI